MTPAELLAFDKDASEAVGWGPYGWEAVSPDGNADIPRLRRFIFPEPDGKRWARLEVDEKTQISEREWRLEPVYRPVTTDDAESAALVRAMESERGAFVLVWPSFAISGKRLGYRAAAMGPSIYPSDWIGFDYTETSFGLKVPGAAACHGTTRKIAIARAAAALGPNPTGKARL